VLIAEHDVIGTMQVVRLSRSMSLCLKTLTTWHWKTMMTMLLTLCRQMLLRADDAAFQLLIGNLFFVQTLLSMLVTSKYSW